MYYLEAEQSFDAAHFLKGYAGKCKNLHGHRWRVVVTVQGETLQAAGPETGMLLDFSTLKDALKALTEEFDHALLLEEGSLRPETLAALKAEAFRMVTLPFRTTAENLARYFYERLRQQDLPVARVAVYETPTNCAVYQGEQEAAHLVQL